MQALFWLRKYPSADAPVQRNAQRLAGVWNPLGFPGFVACRAAGAALMSPGGTRSQQTVHRSPDTLADLSGLRTRLQQDHRSAAGAATRRILAHGPTRKKSRNPFLRPHG